MRQCYYAYGGAAPIAGTSASATTQVGEPTPSCGILQQSVWYKFVATATSHGVSINKLSGGCLSNGVVYSGTCFAFTEIGSNCGISSSANPNMIVLSGLTIGNTYYIQLIYSNGGPCGASWTWDIAVTTCGNAKTWLTSGTTAWGTATNWSPSGVPAACDDVTIPSGGNQPTISAAASCRDLTLNAGAVLTVSQALDIYGSINNNGRFDDASFYVDLFGQGAWGGTGIYATSALVTNGIFRIQNGANYTLTSNLAIKLLNHDGSTGTPATNGVLNFGSNTLTITFGFGNVFYVNYNTGMLDLQGGGSVDVTKSNYGTGTLFLDWPSGSGAGGFNLQDDYYNVYFYATTGNSIKFGNTALTVDIANDMWIKSGTLDNTNAGANTINIGGDFINDGTYSSSTATIKMNGSQSQQITGASRTSFYKLTINNTSSTGVTLNVSGVTKGAVVSNALTLTDGYFYTSAPQLLIINDAATSTSGSAASFVTGPMRKVGNDNFVFPVGNIVSGTPWWRRIGITGTGGLNTDQFDAQYFRGGYSTINILNADSIAGRLLEVSGKEYWMLDRTAGAYTPQVTLYWEDAAASDINSCTADLVIAHLDNTLVENGVNCWELNTTNINPVANCILTGSCAGNGAGTIQSPTGELQYSPFTFGSKTIGGVNPLPVELLYFNVDCKGYKMQAEWETATEQNADYFTLEKSTDGTVFYPISKVTAAGNSSTVKKYSAEDTESFSAVSYYRLSETDFNGQTQTFNMIPVNGCGNKGGFAVYPNPASGIFNVSVSGTQGDNVLIVVRDLLGREFYSQVILLSANDAETIAVDPSGKLAAGVYFVVATSNDTIYKKKLVIK
ncbi:MAG: T9SS type A sorting domain-containing protein [Bacteroidetes bacterium]|nr:T9SS type A sorting domain-containing protein [Bacteroidota bacterium]